MALKITNATANGLANGTGLKEQFDSGFLYLFVGAIPATADEALDMVNVHTQVAKFTESDDGVTGLTFDAPVAGLLSKAAAESWQATVAFDGFDDAEASLVPTFFRFCAGADTGRGAADSSIGYRVQGTIGSLSSGADLVMGETTVEPADLLPVNSFGWRVGQAP